MGRARHTIATQQLSKSSNQVDTEPDYLHVWLQERLMCYFMTQSNAMWLLRQVTSEIQPPEVSRQH